MRRLLTTCGLVLALAAAQPVAATDAPAEAWLADFLPLYQQRDAAGLARFAEARLAGPILAALGGPERAAREFVGLHGVLGPLDLVTVEGRDPAVAYLRGSVSGGWMAMGLAMDPARPERAARLAVTLHARPASASREPPVPVADLPAAADAYLRRLAAHDLFSGVVAVARDGVTLYEGAFGYADRAATVPVTRDTGFALASASKPFTAVAVLQLVEAGALTLDTPVAEHVALQGGPPLDGITVEHLLTHGSGLGTFDVQRIRPLRSVEAMLAVPVAPPVFAPGAAFRYSNVGYLLLGAVVEAVTGRDFYEHLQDEVFAPAGMVGTGAYDLAGERPGIATGFGRPGPDGVRPDDLAVRVRRGSPAADLVATAPDLLRFAEALREGTLLGEPWRSAAMAPQRPLDPRNAALAYGYGFYVEATPAGSRAVGHGGAGAGASAAFTLFPDEGWAIVVLSNYEGVGTVVSRRLQEMLGLR